MTQPPPTLDYATPAAATDLLRHARLIRRRAILGKWRLLIVPIVVIAFVIGFPAPNRSPLRPAAVLIMVAGLLAYTLIAALASAGRTWGVIVQIGCSLFIFMSCSSLVEEGADWSMHRRGGPSVCYLFMLALSTFFWEFARRMTRPATPALPPPPGLYIPPRPIPPLTAPSSEIP